MLRMDWRVETHPAVDAEIETLPVKLGARLLRLLEAIENVGLEALPNRMPSIWAASSGNCG